MSNKYTYSVPFTAEELHGDYLLSGMTQKEIAAKWRVSQKVIHTAMRRLGIIARPAIARNQKLQNNSNWRGGTRLQPATGKRAPFLDRGYRLVYRPGAPNSGKNGYAYEHVLVALEAKGLPSMPEGHCVHHINLRKDENSASNLEICSHKDHQRYHTQLEELAVKLLLDTGKIRFVPEVGYVEA